MFFSLNSSRYCQKLKVVTHSISLIVYNLIKWYNCKFEWVDLDFVRFPMNFPGQVVGSGGGGVCVNQVEHINLLSNKVVSSGRIICCWILYT